MSIKKIIRILIWITGILCVLSTVIQNPMIELYVKPTTVPLFFVLYWFSVKKLDIYFLVILFLCFLGDIFLLTDFDNDFTYVLLCYAICYVMLFYYLYINCKPLSFGNTDIIYFAIFFIIWTLAAIKIYEVTEGAMDSIRSYGIAYLFILCILLIGAVFQYINIRSPKSLWFLVAILNFVISDCSFALERFYIQSLELRTINAIYQLLAVYFLVEFKISSDNSLKIKNIQS